MPRIFPARCLRPSPLMAPDRYTRLSAAPYHLLNKIELSRLNLTAAEGGNRPQNRAPAGRAKKFCPMLKILEQVGLTATHGWVNVRAARILLH